MTEKRKYNAKWHLSRPGEWEKMLSRLPKIKARALEESAEQSRMFAKNFVYLCAKNNLHQTEVCKRLGELEFKLDKGRLERLRDTPGYFISVIEMNMISQFFGLASPTSLISNDLEAQDRMLEGN